MTPEAIETAALADALATRNRALGIASVAVNDNAFGLPLSDSPRIIAFSGVAGSGKSTAARILQAQGYRLVKFAGPLKHMLRAIGLTDEHIEGSLKEVPCDLLAGCTPRYAMQTLGGEWGRETIGDDFWVGLWRHQAAAMLDIGVSVVTDDCRYPNEAAAIRRLGGEIYRLVGRQAEGIDGSHSSERLDFIPDAIIENADIDIDQLRGRITAALTRYAA